MVMKLKAKEHLKKKNIIRQVQCGICGWIVAAPTLAALFGAGWYTGCENEAWAFLCQTCVDKHPQLVKDMNHSENVFRSLPAAPSNPIPCIGCVGDGHVFSRPEQDYQEPHEQI